MTRTRAIILHLLVTTLGCLGVVGRAAAESVRWLPTIEEAIAAATPANKPIMLDFWATWCGPCKIMESEVYTDAGFVRASEHFAAVRIDFDRQTVVARRYNVSALPTLVFTDSYGHELFRYVGAMELKPLRELLLSLPHDVTTFNHWNQVLAKDRHNFEALDAMGHALRAAGLYRKSNEHYAQALERADTKTRPASRETILSEMGANYLDVMDGRRAVEVFQKCLKEFPASPRAPEWTLGLTRARAMTSAR